MSPAALAVVPGRLRAAVSSLPWRSLLADVLVVVAWVAVVSLVARLLEWSTAAYYAVVFAGVVGYSLASAWAGRYRSG